MMEIWPERCTIMMKKSLKYAGAFGLAAILSGCVFVDRNNRDKAKAKEALQETIRTIKRKKVMLSYNEQHQVCLSLIYNTNIV